MGATDKVRTKCLVGITHAKSSLFTPGLSGNHWRTTSFQSESDFRAMGMGSGSKQAEKGRQIDK